jgi:hypothetical protein
MIELQAGGKPVFVDPKQIASITPGGAVGALIRLSRGDASWCFWVDTPIEEVAEAIRKQISLKSMVEHMKFLRRTGFLDPQATVQAVIEHYDAEG